MFILENLYSRFAYYMHLQWYLMIIISLHLCLYHVLLFITQQSFLFFYSTPFIYWHSLSPSFNYLFISPDDFTDFSRCSNIKYIAKEWNLASKYEKEQIIYFHVYAVACEIHNFLCPYRWLKYLCVYVSGSHYPLISWQTSRLFPFLCYCKLSNHAIMNID